MLFEIACTDTPQCSVSFEPEGSLHTLREGDVFDVEVVGPGSGRVEIVFLPDGLIVGAWSGADTRVRSKQRGELPT